MAWNTTSGHTVARELLIAYVNVSSTSTPDWAPFGTRVTDSSLEFDWDSETIKDIRGNVYTDLKKPVVTQSFDPWTMTGGDTAQEFIWGKAVKDHDAVACAAFDCLIVHCYDGTADTAMTAERYSNCAIAVTSLGGEGGGNVGMSTTVTFGGTRTLGTAAITGGVCTFTK